MASGNSLVDYLPSGNPMCRVVPVEPQNYFTGYVSTEQGSFKLPGESGNWYGDTFKVAIAEKKPTGAAIYEWSKLSQNTPVWNANSASSE